MNYPISTKFGSQMQISIPSMEIRQKIEIFHTQDGGWTPYWKSFFWLYHGAFIGRLARNSDRIWRITCRYWSRDQNGNFRKFKMADGRHFENSFISISQSRIIRFRWNLVHTRKFPFRASPELLEILWPKLQRNWRAEELKTPNVSIAMGWNWKTWRASTSIYFCLREAAISAVDPAWRAAPLIYDSANGHVTVTSQHYYYYYLPEG